MCLIRPAFDLGLGGDIVIQLDLAVGAKWTHTSQCKYRLEVCGLRAFQKLRKYISLQAPKVKSRWIKVSRNFGILYIVACGRVWRACSRVKDGAVRFK